MNFFGTDGIRGKAYDTLPLLRAFQFGFAIKSLYANEKVIIGYDTRESAVDYVSALINGLDNTKFEVAGIVTTPMIAYYSNLKSCIGIMVTASHNPYYDNGLKIFIDGYKIDDQAKMDIENHMNKVSEYKHKKIPFKISNHIRNLYLEFIKSLELKNKFNNYIIDAANGSASYVSSDLFDGKIYFNNPNGKNINENCGCTCINIISEINKENEVSFSFDGDGDRVLITFRSKILNGDEIMYIIAKDMVQNGKKPKIACSIMTNPGSVKAFNKIGIDLVETNVGDAFLMKEIRKGNADIGFESSGHFILNYGNNILLGDGLLVAKILIDIFSRYDIDFIYTWLKEIQLSPMKTENLRLEKKLLDDVKIKECLNKIIESKSFDDKIIIRPSGTEDLIRLTVGMKNQNDVEKTLKSIKDCITGVKS